jgi:hypothetical protein
VSSQWRDEEPVVFLAQLLTPDARSLKKSIRGCQNENIALSIYCLLVSTYGMWWVISNHLTLDDKACSRLRSVGSSAT